MDARFHVEVNPRIVRMAKLLELNARDMRQMARQVDVMFTKNERKLFSTQGASGGRRWPKLSPAYAKWKRKRYPGRKIMTREGDLRQSLTSRKHGMHAFHWALKPRPFIEVGTLDEKAAWHGPPNPLKNKKLPVRDVLQHTALQERRYYDIVRKQFRSKAERFMKAARAWRAKRAARG